MTPFFYFYEGVWGQKSSKNKIVHTKTLWDLSVHTMSLLAIFKRPKMT